MAKRSKKQCDTQDCDCEAEVAGLCTACYSWNWYHKQKSVAENQQYKKRQRRANARIEQHMPDRKPTSSKTSGRVRQGEIRAVH
jgi:hypothetical protein